MFDPKHHAYHRQPFYFSRSAVTDAKDSSRDKSKEGIHSDLHH